jgi:hypothetical protein
MVNDVLNRCQHSDDPQLSRKGCFQIGGVTRECTRLRRGITLTLFRMDGMSFRAAIT